MVPSPASAKCTWLAWHVLHVMSVDLRGRRRSPSWWPPLAVVTVAAAPRSSPLRTPRRCASR
jgi:hypothetical protein